MNPKFLVFVILLAVIIVFIYNTGVDLSPSQSNGNTVVEPQKTSLPVQNAVNDIIPTSKETVIEPSSNSNTVLQYTVVEPQKTSLPVQNAVNETRPTSKETVIEPSSNSNTVFQYTVVEPQKTFSPVQNAVYETRPTSKETVIEPSSNNNTVLQYTVVEPQTTSLPVQNAVNDTRTTSKETVIEPSSNSNTVLQYIVVEPQKTSSPVNTINDIRPTSQETVVEPSSSSSTPSVIDSRPTIQPPIDKRHTPCDPGETDDGLFCRKEECPPDSILRNGLCYTTRPCGPNERDTGLSCETCPPDKINNGKGLCYTPCEAEYEFDGDSKCNSKNQNIGAGRPKTDCTNPAFPNKSGALCYSNCQNEYRYDNGTCKRDCAPGEKDKGASCEKCPDGMVNNGASLCYKPCDPKYDFDGTMTCNRLDNKNVGGGTVPNECPSGWTSWGALCYAPCDTGFTFRDGSCQRTDNGYGIPKGTFLPCRGGKVQKGLLCYETCRDGYKHNNNVAPVSCVPNDDRLLYVPSTQNRGCGDKENIDGLCYNRCDPGWEHIPGMPYLCRKIGGQSYITQTALPASKPKLGNLPVSLVPNCPQGTEEVDGLCYSMCPQNYKRIPGQPYNCIGSRGPMYTVTGTVPISRPKETSTVPKVTTREK